MHEQPTSECCHIHNIGEGFMEEGEGETPLPQMFTEKYNGNKKHNFVYFKVAELLRNIIIVQAK